MSKLLATGFLLIAVAAAPAAWAEDRRGGDVIEIALSGAQEDPTVITSGRGRAFLRIQGNRVAYTVRYSRLESDIEQAHIHIGDDDNTGGIAVFLCSDLGNGPPGTPACPPAPGQLSGVIEAADVLGPVAQGVPVGSANDFIRAVRAGLVYVNIHTVVSPSGEIRGDIKRRNHHH